MIHFITYYIKFNLSNLCRQRKSSWSASSGAGRSFQYIFKASFRIAKKLPGFPLHSKFSLSPRSGMHLFSSTMNNRSNNTFENSTVLLNVFSPFLLFQLTGLPRSGWFAGLINIVQIFNFWHFWFWRKIRFQRAAFFWNSFSLSLFIIFTPHLLKICSYFNQT